MPACAIVSIDYRPAPQAKVDQIIEDLHDAYVWVRTEGPKLFRADPDRRQGLWPIEVARHIGIRD